jgi:glucosamine--fructose-6-phosphate aminotransferase (isomerizing)
VELRERLTKHGCKFVSDTDTEAVAHLVSQEMKSGKSPADDGRGGAQLRCGALALAFLFTGRDDLPDRSTQRSPLAIGYGNGEMYLGSDAIALAPFTDTISYLDDGDWAVLTAKASKFTTSRAGRLSGRSLSPQLRHNWSTRATTSTSCTRKSMSSRKWSVTPLLITSTW